MYKEAIGHVFLLPQKRTVQNLSQRYFLRLLNLSFIKCKVSTIIHISIFYINIYGLQKIPSLFLKKLKRLIVRLMQRLLRDFTLPNIIEPAFQGGDTFISLEIDLFGVINLNIHFFRKNSFERAV